MHRSSEWTGYFAGITTEISVRESQMCPPNICTKLSWLLLALSMIQKSHSDGGSARSL
jgi:hypothetical protein